MSKYGRDVCFDSSIQSTLQSMRGNKEEANRLASEYVDSLLQDYTKDSGSNFYPDYSKPSEFKALKIFLM